MSHPYISLFEVFKEMDRRVAKAVDHFNAGRLRGFLRNYPFMRVAYECMNRMGQEALEDFMYDNSIYIRFTSDMQKFAQQAHETFLSLIEPGVGNLNCLEHLLDSDDYDEDHWIGFFGNSPEVNQMVIRYAGRQRLSLSQSERLYEIGSALLSRGEDETAHLMIENASEKIAERFAISRGEQGGEAMAKAFLCCRNQAEFFNRIAAFDLLLLMPFLKKELDSNNQPFETVELVERSLCFLVSNQKNTQRPISIERAIEKLKAAGFGDEVLRRTPATRREMLCEDLGM